MENMTNSNQYGAVAALPCAISAAATLEVRAAAITRTWDAATTGMKRTAFAPAHVKGFSAWSPPL